MVNRRKDNKKRVLKEGEYQRQNGTFEFKWRDALGNRHSIYAKTLEKLREKELDILRASLEGIRTDSNIVTVNDLYKLWKDLKRGLKENTFQNYMYMYTQFVEETFGKAKIKDIKRTDVRAFYNTLSEQYGLKTNTIDSLHTVLHQVLELGVENEYIRYNPSDGALKELKRACNKESIRVKALTKEEQNLFTEFLKKPGKYNRWYPIFIFMLWTGMRVGEATGIRWCDIDFENDEITVDHTLVFFAHKEHKKCIYAINTPKTEAGKRTIPMLPIVKDALLMERQLQKEFGIECKSVIDGYTDFVFLNRYGEVHNIGTLNKALNKIIRDCNFAQIDKTNSQDKVTLLPRFSNHSLRHTFTTRMCEAGVNIKAMQDILGHKDAETTLQIYTDATRDLKKREMRNLADYFKDGA